MSPLAAPPLRGYSEFQRLQNWDSSVLYQQTARVIPPTETSPVFDVSRYAYIAGYDIAGTSNMSVVVRWYSDPAGTNIVGQRQLMLSVNLRDNCQYRLPNMGPYVQFVWDQAGAGAISHSVVLFATNRYHPLELIPLLPMVVNSGSQVLPASTTLTIWPTDYYAGPLGIYCTTSVAATLTMQILDDTNAWQIAQQVTLAAAANQSFQWVSPPGAYRFLLKNLTATLATYTLTCTVTMTGAL